MKTRRESEQTKTGKNEKNEKKKKRMPPCGSSFASLPRRKELAVPAAYHGSRAREAQPPVPLDSSLSFLCESELATLKPGTMSLRGIQPLSYSGLDDLTRFLAWSEQIKLDMSMSNPSLFRVLGEVATAKHPIAGGESFQTESGAKELREKEGRELGCLLVQRAQGEIQLKVTKWLVATNGWEAWRQLNYLSFLSRLLASLLQTSFEDTPASCLQQLSAWKERVVIYQKLSGEQLSESIMMSVVMNGLTEKARHLLLLHLDGDSSFGDLEHLLATHLAEQELDNRVDYQENSSLEQEPRQAEACQRRQRKRKEHKRERGSLQSPASSLPRQGEASASQQRAKSLQRQARQRKGQDEP